MIAAMVLIFALNAPNQQIVSGGRVSRWQFSRDSEVVTQKKRKPGRPKLPN